MATAGRTTKLGDDLTVSAIGFGAGALAVYGDADDSESLATLNRCLDLGVTFVDTANVYGGGSNERLIARLLADRRDEVTVATKFGIVGTPADRAFFERLLHSVQQLVFIEGLAAAIAFDDGGQQQLGGLESGEAFRTGQAFATPANLSSFARKARVDYLGLRVAAKRTMHGALTPVPMRTVPSLAIDGKSLTYFHHLGARTFHR